MIPYTMTNETISVLHAGKTHMVRKGAANFTTLREALLAEDWDAVPSRLTVAKAVADWCKGKFTVDGDLIKFEGEPLPSGLNGRIVQMVANGDDPTLICNFWEKLQKNPSKRSVDQLWPFLQQQGIPLTKEGNFLAYKGVRRDYKDAHSGTYDNSPGAVHEMPRNKISDDPNEACHEGFHVGALEYARGFSERVVVCEVDPADVVCVPYDYSCQKMRVTKYKVIGNHNGEFLPETSYEPDDVSEVDDDDLILDDDLSMDEIEELENEECGDCSDCGECDECSPIVEATVVQPPPLPTVPYRFKKIHAMDTNALFEQTMEKLRDYAANGLKIVGASRIPGGKVALIRAIEDVRH